MTRIVLGLLFGAMFLACATTGEQTKRLSPGMDKEDVVREMGRPDGFETIDSAQCYLYYNKLISGWSWDRADYRLCFRDGKLSDYKAINIREKQPATTNTVIIHEVK